MKYCIVHVNDRSIDKIDRNKNILKDFEYVDGIEFFNGNTGNGRDVLNHIGVNCDAWAPYDGRSMPALPGEYGVWVSLVNTWQYMIDNSIESLLVLEDDISLTKNFVSLLEDTLTDLPEGYDFLSLYYFNEQNEPNEELSIGSEKIQKANDQHSAGQATLYSLKGAKKFLKLLKRKGLEYTSDCFIFRQVKEGLVEGYSILGDREKFVSHEFSNIKSLIDPENIRDTPEL